MLFKMEVELGNEAMQSGLDVAHALVRTAGRIDRAVGRDPLASGEQGVVMDANGNTVGSWEVVADA